MGMQGLVHYQKPVRFPPVPSLRALVGTFRWLEDCNHVAGFVSVQLARL